MRCHGQKFTKHWKLFSLNLSQYCKSDCMFSSSQPVAASSDCSTAAAVPLCPLPSHNAHLALIPTPLRAPQPSGYPLDPYSAPHQPCFTSCSCSQPHLTHLPTPQPHSPSSSPSPIYVCPPPLPSTISSPFSISFQSSFHLSFTD